MGLRTQDPVPAWVSHLALVSEGRVTVGEKEEVLATKVETVQRASAETGGRLDEKGDEAIGAGGGTMQTPCRELLVDMQNVNVQYHDRKVGVAVNKLTGNHLLIFVRSVTGANKHHMANSRRRALAPPRRKR